MNTRRASTLKLLAVLTVVAAAIVTVVGMHNRNASPKIFGLPTAPTRTDPQKPVTLRQQPANPHIGKAKLFTTRPRGYLVSMPWELVGLRDGGRTLVVHVVGGDGVRPGGIYSLGFTVIDKPTAVELIAISRNDNPDSESQAGSLQTGIATITLAAPITGRKLLHAPANDGWQQYLHE